jgi:outer membrane protein assembly factor BamB
LITTLDGNLHGVSKYDGKKLWMLPAVSGALVKTKASVGHQLNDDNEWVFVIEPADNGTLYMFTRKTGLRPVGSMKHLAMTDPSFLSEGLFYHGKKTTKTIALDPGTGKVLRTFSTDDGFSCLLPDGEEFPGETLLIAIAGKSIADAFPIQFSLCIAP